MLVRDPGPPTGDLGAYYLSYGAGIDEESLAEMTAARDAAFHRPVSSASWPDELVDGDAGYVNGSYHGAGPDDVVCELIDDVALDRTDYDVFGYRSSDYEHPDDNTAYSNTTYDGTTYDGTAFDGMTYDTSYYDAGYHATADHDRYRPYGGDDLAMVDAPTGAASGWSTEDAYRTDEYYPSYVTHLLRRLVDRVDRLPTGWMNRYATRMIQISLGVIFGWFGALKFFPGLSPAEGLVRATVTELLTVFGLASFPATVALIFLAGWEVVIGLGFLLDVRRRVVVWMLLVHMIGTALPLVLLPEIVWTQFPHGLTLEGQYIIKNLALVGGAMAVGASSRRPVESLAGRVELPSGR